MAEYAGPILVILLLIGINALFVAAEFAIVSAPYARIARRAERGSRMAKQVLAVLRDNDSRDRYIAAAQIGITIASLGLGMYGEASLAHWLEGPLSALGAFSEAAAHTIAFLIAVSILTYLHVVLGEMIPKSLAIQSAEETVLRLAAPMAATQRLLYPLVALLNGLGNVVTRLLGVPPAGAQERLYSADELEYLVEESTTGGLIEPAEKLYFENIFDFGERTASQVMTPRNRIVGVAADSGEDEVLDQVSRAPFTRFPVFRRSLDDVTGILHVKSLARQQANGSDFDLAALLSPPVFLPETLPLKDTLAQLRRRGRHLAIMVDEYGGVAGLVTLEDVVEEVVGEIRDEFDQELPPMKRVGPGAVQARGDLILDELNQHFDLQLVHPEVETVGGLIMTLLGRVPQAGDRVEVEGVTFEVEVMDGMAVKTARVTLPERGA